MEKRKVYIGIFSVVTFFYWSAIFSHVSILSGHAEELGATTAFIGIISGSYGVSQVLLRLPLGFLSDKLNNRKIFIICSLVAVLAAGILMFFTDAPEGLLAGRLLCGAAGCAFVQISVLFTSYFPEDETPHAMALIVAISNSSQMAGMLIGGFVASLLGKGYAFLLTAIFAAAGLLLSFFIYDNPVKSVMRFSDLKIVASRRNLQAASVLGVICLIMAYGKSFTYVPLLANRIGASSFQQGLVTSIFSFVSILSALVSRRLRTSAKNVVMMGFIFHAAGSFLIPVKEGMPMLYLSQALSGVGNGLTFSLLMSISISGIKDSMRGSGMGIFQTIYGLGMIAGPILFGYISQSFSMSAGFITFGALSLAGAVLTQLLLKNYKYA